MSLRDFAFELPDGARRAAVDLNRGRHHERQSAIGEFKARCKRIDEWTATLTNPQWREAATAIGAKHKESEADFDSFRTEALNAFEGVKKITASPEIGMDQRDLSKYSLVRAINCLASRKPLEGLEKACSDAAAKLQFLGKTPLTEAVRRAAAELVAAEATAAGARAALKPVISVNAGVQSPMDPNDTTDTSVGLNCGWSSQFGTLVILVFFSRPDRPVWQSVQKLAATISAPRGRAARRRAVISATWAAPFNLTIRS